VSIVKALSSRSMLSESVQWPGFIVLPASDERAVQFSAATIAPAERSFALAHTIAGGEDDGILSRSAAAWRAYCTYCLPRTIVRATEYANGGHGKADGAKYGRGGRSLLTGLLLCGRCGRRLKVVYSGRAPGQPVYRCEFPNQMFGRPRCIIFGAKRVDAAIARELLRALEPMAIDAALQAERRHMELQGERRRIVELELQQAQYEASLAERRYAACDPDNRLIPAQLERSWEATLLRVQACEARLAAVETPGSTAPVPDFVGLADDLEAAWNAPGVTMRSRQQLLRALIAEIIADYDQSSREIILTIRWRGGQHSELRVSKPRSGEHGCRTTDEAVGVIDTMATRWSDTDIAATLNRMGLPTGQGRRGLQTESALYVAYEE
jgi:hypothetical protein